MVSKILLTMVSIIFFVGCQAAKYNMPSMKTEAQIINSDQVAYTIFATQELAGKGEPIFEYFPDTQTFKLVAIMTRHEKYIYPMPEGTHYFYSMGGETYDFIRVEAKKGKKYYVNIDTVFWSWRMTPPIEFEPVTDKEDIEDFDRNLLVQNNQKTFEWFNKRKDNPDFKEKVKDRFEDWAEDDMEDKTLFAKDGFDVR